MDAGAVTTAILTAALVLITAYYARQNKRMVEEMAASRRVAVLPKLALDLKGLAPTVDTINVANVGPGPALHVDLSLVFEPHDPSKHERDERRLKANVLAPGEEHQFLPLTRERSVMHTEEFAATFARIALTGTMRDALGNSEQVEDRLDDLAERRRLLEEAKVRFLAEPEKRLAEAIGKQVAKPLDKGTRELRDIRRHLGRIAPPEEPDE